MAHHKVKIGKDQDLTVMIEYKSGYGRAKVWMDGVALQDLRFNNKDESEFRIDGNNHQPLYGKLEVDLIIQDLPQGSTRVEFKMWINDNNNVKIFECGDYAEGADEQEHLFDVNIRFKP